MFKNVTNHGYINVEDSTSSVFKIRVSDFKQNETWINIPIRGKLDSISTNPKPYNTKLTTIYSDKPTTLQSGIVTVNFSKNTVYDDIDINFRVSSDSLFLHEDIIPLKKNFYINYDMSRYKSADINKTFISRIYGNQNKLSYVNTKRKGNILSSSTKLFGRYTLSTDSVAPVIKALNFQNKKWLSKSRYLKIKIEDNFSGISKYRATINGKWILMEYDYKTKTLTHDFYDNVVNDTKNQIKLIVTDNVGNSSTFEATFFRKQQY